MNIVIPIHIYNNEGFIYELNDKTNNNEWRKINNKDIIMLLKIIQIKLMKLLLNWRNINNNLIIENDNICDKYNKIMVKITNISINDEDKYYKKYKKIIYDYLNTKNI
jgi:hypothetical protein